MTASSINPIRLRLAQLAAHLVVALVALVVIGGATRVMEAGLACPDWPLCYGSLLPGRQMNVQVFLEWFHRLDAFVVGVALLVQMSVVWWHRRDLPGWLLPLSALLVLMVVLQGGLGALTVLKLLPSGVVTAHLALALMLVITVSGLTQTLSHPPSPLRPLAGGPFSVHSVCWRFQLSAFWVLAWPRPGPHSAVLRLASPVNGCLGIVPRPRRLLFVCCCSCWWPCSVVAGVESSGRFCWQLLCWWARRSALVSQRCVLAFHSPQ